MRALSRILARLFAAQDWRWGTSGGVEDGFVPNAEAIDDTINQLIALIELEGVTEAEAGRLLVKRTKTGYDVYTNFGGHNG